MSKYYFTEEDKKELYRQGRYLALYADTHTDYYLTKDSLTIDDIKELVDNHNGIKKSFDALLKQMQDCIKEA